MNTRSRRSAAVPAAFLLGVVAAAVGTGTAASLITGKDVKDNSLTGADIRSGSLTGADIRSSSLTGADIRSSSLTGADIRSGSLTGADIRSSSLTGAHVRNGSIGPSDLSAAVKSSLKGDAGARGRQGATGPRGAPGSNATGLTMGTTSMTGAVTRFAPLGGTGAGDALASEAPGITPNAALAVSAMAVRAYNLGAGEQITVTLQLDNVDTALSCTVTAAVSLCAMPGTLSLPPRSSVGVKLVSSAFAATRVVSWSWSFS